MVFRVPFFHGTYSREACYFWMKFAAFGYCSYFGLGLHFTFILIGKDRLLKKWWLLLILHGPGIVFLIKAITGKLAAIDFIYKYGMWYQILPINSIWYWSYIFISVFYLFLCFLYIFIWGIRSNSTLVKKQAKTILYFGVTPLLIGVLTNIILPA